MKKLWKQLDNYILKIGVIIAILFIPLYPKLPSIHVPNTWVYIRLEDFLILGLAIIWLIQLKRKKVAFPKPEGYTLILYWIVGLMSLIYCLAFIAPYLTNFFPKIAFLQYARRIEYMILFFIGFASVKNIRDVYTYVITLGVAVFGIVLYGFGQRFYFLLWHLFPDFFQKYPFCFPAFLTGNEEFAKGIPLCLNDTSRITSTFGGHYDLSAYLVFIIPLLVALAFTVKRVYLKVIMIILSLFALELLNFTSSRTSFGAYVIGIVSMLILWQKKKWIIPILAVSIGVMMLFGNSTIQRFSKTIQEVQVVSTDAQLPADLQKMITDAKDAENIKKSEVPPASDFTVTQDNLTTQNTGYSTTLTPEQLERIRNGDLAIASVSGSFLIKKAYALDISFTTRFQGEWPRNWNAFMHSPVFGTGYSSLTLATDNDYLRALGETGIAGLLAFLFIFVILGIYVKNVIGKIENPVVKGLLFGLVGGVIGLLANAVLIDVFEASKVAESMWLLLGIGMGAAALSTKKKVNYKAGLASLFTSRILLLIYLFLLIFIVFGSSIANFFAADDFIMLRRAASINVNELLGYFTNSQGFFYRPLTNVILYYLYAVFSFQPQGYHVFLLLLHICTTIGVYLIAERFYKNKLPAFMSAAFFAIHPVLAVNVLWLSTLPVNLSTFFLVYAVLLFINFRESKKFLYYVFSLLCIILALLSYEGSFSFFLTLLLIDVIFYKYEMHKRTLILYLPFALMVLGYFVLQYYSSAQIVGGNYDMMTLLPNTVCNYIGYVVSFLFGTVFFSLPNVHTLSGVGICFVIFLLIGAILYFLYKKKNGTTFSQNLQLISFGLGFALLTLASVLPLNNIEGKYIYPAAIGLSVLLSTLLYLFSAYITRNAAKKNYKYILFVLLSVVILIIYWVQVKNESVKWQQASLLTKKTLTFFRVNYPGFPQSSALYFVDTPAQQQGVWVFPVGLLDSLWFIYRDDTLQVYDHAEMTEAKNADRLSPTATYIFQFKDGTISEIK